MNLAQVEEALNHLYTAEKILYNQGFAMLSRNIDETASLVENVLDEAVAKAQEVLAEMEKEE